MYNANDMRQVACEARQKREIMKKCVAQQFFAKVYPAIEEAAANGDFSLMISIYHLLSGSLLPAVCLPAGV